jgi:aldehyde dehydrogenase (NAD+)
MKIFRNFVGGSWVEPSSGEHFENVNPADTKDVIGRFPLSTAADVEKAVASAKRGFAIWRDTPAPARGDVLRRVGDLLSSRKDEIADLMTREMGKPLQETKGDVQEGIDTAYYAATEGRRLFGHTVPSELRAKWAMSFRRPIGVCGLVTPFNFPMAIPTWKMFPALLCGNAFQVGIAIGKLKGVMSPQTPIGRRYVIAHLFRSSLGTTWPKRRRPSVAA